MLRLSKAVLLEQSSRSIILFLCVHVINGFSHHLSQEWFSPLFSQPTLNESSRLPLIGRPFSIPRDRLAERSRGPTPFTETSLHSFAASFTAKAPFAISSSI
ncbi:uncharacterized [Tachysurus ichikawai]